MTAYYPTWEEANRHVSHGREVKMGPDGRGHMMYYVAKKQMPRTTPSPEAITAQIACEAVANNPTAYDTSDIEAVIHTAERVGVSDTYTEALKTHRSQAWFDEAYGGF